MVGLLGSYGSVGFARKIASGEIVRKILLDIRSLPKKQVWERPETTYAVVWIVVGRSALGKWMAISIFPKTVAPMSERADAIEIGFSVGLILKSSCFLFADIIV